MVSEYQRNSLAVPFGLLFQSVTSGKGLCPIPGFREEIRWVPSAFEVVKDRRGFPKEVFILCAVASDPDQLSKGSSFLASLWMMGVEVEVAVGVCWFGKQSGFQSVIALIDCRVKEVDSFFRFFHGELDSGVCTI